MKRILSKVTVALIITCIITVSIIIPANAGNNGSISASSYEPNVGDEVQVRATYKSSEEFALITGHFIFDNEHFKLVKGGKVDSKEKNKVIINISNPETNEIIVTFKAVSPATTGTVEPFECWLTAKKTANDTTGISLNETTRSRRISIKGSKALIDDTAKPTESDSPELSDGSFEFEGAKYSIVVPEVSYPNYELHDDKYNDADIKTLADKFGKYKLVFAKNNKDLKTGLFNLTEDGKIEALEYLELNKDIYIIEMPDTTNKEPDGDWQTGKCTLSNGLTVDCFESKKSVMSDFYIFLCYHDGESSYFRYDKATNILQREPGFALIDYQPVESSARHGFIGRLAILSSEAKALIFLSVLEFILIIVLIVLIVLKKRKTPAPIEEA